MGKPKNVETEKKSQETKKPFRGKGKGRGKFGSKPMGKEDFKSNSKTPAGVRAIPEYDRNDPDWYTPTAEVIKAAASLPFSAPVGTNVVFNTNALTSNQTWSLNNRAIPGVMALQYMPTIGISSSFESAVNIAARKLYSEVLHANSRATAYDPADLMFYVLAVGQCYAMLEDMKRLYGMIKLYTPTNRYYPMALVEAAGYDYTDMESHINDLWGFINMYAYKVNQFAIPDNIKFFDRMKWLPQNYFIDENSDKAQTYIFTPIGYWQYNEMTGGAGQLDWFAKPTSLGAHMTFAQLVTYANGLIAPLVSSQDIKNMSGDIIKCYGDKIAKASEIDVNYRALPMYDEIVLSQIMNSVSCTALLNQSIGGGIPSITQNAANFTGAIIWNPIIEHISATGVASPETQSLLLDRLISLSTDSVDPNLVMESSRFTFTLKSANATGGGTDYFIDTCDTAIIVNYRVFQFVMAAGAWALNHTDGGNSVIYDSSAQMTAASLRAINHVVGNFTKFDWHPIMYIAQKTGTSSHSWDDYMFDVCNYTA